MKTALTYNPDLKNLKGIREGIGDELDFQARHNPNIFVLTANLKESTKVDKFAQNFPDRFYDVGVSEQNLAGICAGLGLTGNTVFMSSYSVFSPGRNWDQIRVSVCYSNANVKIIGGHTGLRTGKDGATHQALEDIAITRVLPNMEVITPVDYFQAREAIKYAVHKNGPVYIRSYRDKTPQLFSEETNFDLKIPQVVKPGKDLSIITHGPILFDVIEAINSVEDKLNISIELINVSCIKPLNSREIIKSLNKTKIGISIEDHQVAGGLGSAILEAISETHPTPFKIIGVNDTFGESGDVKDLYQKYGLSSDKLSEKIIQFLKRSK